MPKGRDSWRDSFRSVGVALLDVVRAELAVVGDSLKRSSRELGIGVALAIGAAFLFVVCVPALLILSAVAGLHSGLGWPLWGAALAVAGGVAVIGGILGALAWYVMSRRFENPVATVQNRVADHVAWWNQRILTDETTLGESNEDPEPGDGTSGEPPSGARDAGR